MKLPFSFSSASSSSDDHKPSRPRMPFGMKLGAGISAFALAAGVGISALQSTPEHTVNLVTQGGKVVGALAVGYDFKIPVLQNLYPMRTDLIEIEPAPPSIALQNGTITATNIQSSAFLRINGTRAQQEETVKEIYSKMSNFESRVASLTDKALRDVIRGSVIPTSSDSMTGEKAEKIGTEGKPNFLDSVLIGQLVADHLQGSLNATIPGKINVGTDAKPDWQDRIIVTQVKIGNFDWNPEYKTKRNEIQSARADAERAGFKEQENIRLANGEREKARGEKDAAILRGEGASKARELALAAEATGVLAMKNAEAEGLSNQVKAAGGVDKLREIILAQQWNGSNAVITGAGTSILDARDMAAAANVTVPRIAPAPSGR